MKKMFALMAVTALCQFAFSQQNPPVQNDANHQTQSGYRRHHMEKKAHKNMINDLNLTDDQKAKMKEMRLANKEKKDAILNNSSLSETQKRDQLKEIHKESRKQFENTLTDEQKAKMKTMKEQWKKNRNFKNGKLKRPEKAEKVIDNTNQ